MAPSGSKDSSRWSAQRAERRSVARTSKAEAAASVWIGREDELIVRVNEALPTGNFGYNRPPKVARLLPYRANPKSKEVKNPRVRNTLSEDYSRLCGYLRLANTNALKAIYDREDIKACLDALAKLEEARNGGDRSRTPAWTPSDIFQLLIEGDDGPNRHHGRSFWTLCETVTAPCPTTEDLDRTHPDGKAFFTEAFKTTAARAFCVRQVMRLVPELFRESDGFDRLSGMAYDGPDPDFHPEDIRRSIEFVRGYIRPTRPLTSNRAAQPVHLAYPEDPSLPRLSDVIDPELVPDIATSSASAARSAPGIAASHQPPSRVTGLVSGPDAARKVANLERDVATGDQMARLLGKRVGEMFGDITASAKRMPRLSKEDRPRVLNEAFGLLTPNDSFPPHLTDHSLAPSRPGEPYIKPAEARGGAHIDPAVFAVMGVRGEVAHAADAEQPVEGDPAEDARLDKLDMETTNAERFYSFHGQLVQENIIAARMTYVQACSWLDLDPAKPIMGDSDGLKLEPHQVIGVVWLVQMESEATNGAILADATGLGKTLTVLSYLAYLTYKNKRRLKAPYRPCLVVVPAGLIQNWYDEYQRSFGVSGSIRLRVMGWHNIKDTDPRRLSATTPDAMVRGLAGLLPVGSPDDLHPARETTARAIILVSYNTWSTRSLKDKQYLDEDPSARAAVRHIRELRRKVEQMVEAGDDVDTGRPTHLLPNVRVTPATAEPPPAPEPEPAVDPALEASVEALGALMATRNILAKPEPEKEVDEDTGASIVSRTQPLVSLVEGCFGTVILDEGHSVKNSKSTWFASVAKLDARSYIVCTATPVLNRAVDLVAYLKLFELRHLRDVEINEELVGGLREYYDKMGPRDGALLSSHTFGQFLDSNGDIADDMAMSAMNKVLAFVQLKRTMATTIDRGEGLGGVYRPCDQVAPYKIWTVEVDPSPAEIDYHSAVARYWCPKIRQGGGASDGSKAGRRNNGAIRRLAIAATFSGVDAAYERLGIDVDEAEATKEMREAIRTWDHGLSFLFDSMVTDPFYESGGLGSAEAFIKYFTRRSSKFAALAGILQFHRARDEKILILCEYPSLQWAVEIFCSLAGLSVASVKQQTKEEERGAIIAEFNDKTNKKFEVLVSTTRLLGVGFNFHADCHALVIMNPARGSNYHIQAIGRIYRMGQEYLGYVYIMHARNTVDRFIEASNMDKYRPNLASLGRDYFREAINEALINAGHPIDADETDPVIEAIRHAAIEKAIDELYRQLFGHATNFNDDCYREPLDLGWGRSVYSPGDFPAARGPSTPMSVRTKGRGATARLHKQPARLGSRLHHTCPLCYLRGITVECAGLSESARCLCCMKAYDTNAVLYERTPPMGGAGIPGQAPTHPVRLGEGHICGQFCSKHFNSAIDRAMEELKLLVDPSVAVKKPDLFGLLDSTSTAFAHELSSKEAGRIVSATMKQIRSDVSPLTGGCNTCRLYTLDGKALDGTDDVDCTPKPKQPVHDTSSPLPKTKRRRPEPAGLSSEPDDDDSSDAEYVVAGLACLSCMGDHKPCLGATSHTRSCVNCRTSKTRCETATCQVHIAAQRALRQRPEFKDAAFSTEADNAFMHALGEFLGELQRCPDCGPRLHQGGKDGRFLEVHAQEQLERVRDSDEELGDRIHSFLAPAAKGDSEILPDAPATGNGSDDDMPRQPPTADWGSGISFERTAAGRAKKTVPTTQDAPAVASSPPAPIPLAKAAVVVPRPSKARKQKADSSSASRRNTIPATSRRLRSESNIPAEDELEGEPPKKKVKPNDKVGGASKAKSTRKGKQLLSDEHVTDSDDELDGNGDLTQVPYVSNSAAGSQAQGDGLA